MTPDHGEQATPCCNRSPLELPLDDRLTLDAAVVDCATDARRWEYRGVACEPDTGDTYDSTRPVDTREEAEQTARDWGLLDASPDLPQLVLRVERRLKAGPWGAVPEHVHGSMT